MKLPFYAIRILYFKLETSPSSSEKSTYARGKLYFMIKSKPLITLTNNEVLILFTSDMYT